MTLTVALLITDSAEKTRGSICIVKWFLNSDLTEKYGTSDAITVITSTKNAQVYELIHTKFKSLQYLQ